MRIDYLYLLNNIIIIVPFWSRTKKNVSATLLPVHAVRTHGALHIILYFT